MEMSHINMKMIEIVLKMFQKIEKCFNMLEVNFGENSMVQPPSSKSLDGPVNHTEVGP